jgi:hypothetical protein
MPHRAGEQQERSPEGTKRVNQVLSNGQLQQSLSEGLELEHNEEVWDEPEGGRWGNAREHVERSERRMRERIGSLERMYALSLEEL